MFPYCQLCHAVVEDGLRRVSSFFNLWHFYPHLKHSFSYTDTNV
jgi:hypothetical protein